jgi:hypothetical protein
MTAARSASNVDPSRDGIAAQTQIVCETTSDRLAVRPTPEGSDALEHLVTKLVGS